MSSQILTRTALAIVATVASASLCAEEVPLANWTVPPYRSAAAGGGMTTMTDATPAVPFIGVQPCRLVDTRAGSGFPAGYGSPSLAPGVPRNFDLNSQPNCPGFPSGVDAYSLNVTVTNTAGAGHLVIFPQGGAQPVVSSLNYLAGQTIPNAVIVAAGTGGGITIVAGVSGTDVIIDINGYFSNEQNPGQSLIVIGSRSGPLIGADNGSAAFGATGVIGVAANPAAGDSSAGVLGIGSGSGYGVRGSTDGDNAGVFGASSGGHGVRGFSNASIGVVGEGPLAGVRGLLSSTSGSGVVGSASDGATFGVHGLNTSGTANSAGVRGLATLPANVAATTFSPSGVRGESKDGNGTIGISESTAVGGFLMNPATGGLLAQGRLGTTFGSDPDGGGPPWAVHAQGNIGASGTKAFLEPHPKDPTKVIQYVALEGPEAGTYFRGKARFQRGLARIPVPEGFRMVTDPEGLTVQITPIGGMASFGVVRMDLDEIVVQGSRDLEFSYLVQGVRASFKDLQTVIRDGTFLPQTADARLPTHLAERQKRILIETGVYNADGTVNMQTARRLGLDRMWERRARRPEPAAD